jgi:hypothetical protein
MLAITLYERVEKGGMIPPFLFWREGGFLGREMRAKRKGESL